MLQQLTRCEHEHVVQGMEKGREGGSRVDWLDLRLDVVTACSCAMHVVRTPGLSNRVVQNRNWCQFGIDFEVDFEMDFNF